MMVRLCDIRYLNERDLPNPLWILLECVIQCPHSGHKALGVVKTVNAKNNLDKKFKIN